MRLYRGIGILVLGSALGASCVGTTGSNLVSFHAAAAGPEDAVDGAPLVLADNGRGYKVSLTTATLHVGAVYLDSSRPLSGAQETDCILPGTYVAEVTQGLDVDALSPKPQPFPGKGEATSTPATVGQVWFNHDDVNAPEDPSPVLTVAGTAEKGGVSYPFQGTLTIGVSNRIPPNVDPSQPNLRPICKERIVADIELELVPTSGGSLLLRVDPRGFFTNVDFARLTKVSDAPLMYRFDDVSQGQPNVNLYHGLHASSGVYQISWLEGGSP